MNAQHPVRRRVVALVVLLGSASALHAAAPPAPRSLEDCEALVRGQPPKPSAWRCFWWVARSTGQSAEAARRLKAHLQSDPGNPAILLNLGRTESDQGLEDARLHMEAAVGLFQRQGSQEGEFASRLALAFFCGLRKDHECEQSQFPRLEHIAEATGNADFRANVLLHESHHAGHEADYAHALSLMKQAQAVPLPEGPYYLKGHILSGLVGIYMALGMYQEGFATARLEVAHVRQTGDIFELASALHNLSLLAGYDPEGTGVQEAERLAITQEALDTALRSGNTRAEGMIRLSLSQELSFSLERRLDEAAMALELGRRAQVIPQVCFALRRLAQLEFMKGRSWEEEALELADQAIETARVSGDLFHIARGWIVRASLGWVHGDDERALADSLRALDAVERIRDLQPDELVRTRLSAQWTMPYYRFSGQALERALAGDKGYLDAGFMMMERLRGRVLLGAMDAMRITEEMQPGGDAAARRRGILDRIAGMQKVLMEAGQPSEETRRLLADLERLEAQEAASRSELAAADDRWSTLRHPRAPALAEVQRALAPDEALLAFQVASDETDEESTPLKEGGSWLLVVTRGGIRLERLPSRRKLGPQVTLYEALIQRRDGSDVPGGVALYQAVLAGGLRGLPGEVRRLIVIPDDVLYHLSFDALRPGIEAPALGEQFEISIAPSATLWMRWRNAAAVAAPRAVLALADPDLPSAGPAPGALRQTAIPAATMVRPGRLPRARREAAAVAGMIGGDSQALSGAAASESLLKHADFSRFGMLHLAAHAVMDAQRPERSAVLLAAGDSREDGLLQMRDVVGLPLQGRAVMLAACDSSSGALARGEGVMSLARAFFQAGATAVVGSLWPLRDDEAEQFVRPFYSRLAGGQSVAGALAATRRERMISGAPTAAWAGMVVLGDGGMVPFAAAPGSVAGGAAGGASSWGIAAGAALLMMVSAVALRRRRRRA